MNPIPSQANVLRHLLLDHSSEVLADGTVSVYLQATAGAGANNSKWYLDDNTWSDTKAAYGTATYDSGNRDWYISIRYEFWVDGVEYLAAWEDSEGRNQPAVDRDRCEVVVVTIPDGCPLGVRVTLPDTSTVDLLPAGRYNGKTIFTIDGSSPGVPPAVHTLYWDGDQYWTLYLAGYGTYQWTVILGTYVAVSPATGSPVATALGTAKDDTVAKDSTVAKNSTVAKEATLTTRVPQAIPFTNNKVDANATATADLGDTAPAGWINSAAVVNNALNGKGDWYTNTSGVRLLGSARVGPAAKAQSAVINDVVLRYGTTALVARVLNWDGDDLVPGDVSAVTYSVYEMDDRGEYRSADGALAGYSSLSLTPSDVIMADVMSDAIATNYNVKFTPPAAAFAEDRYYLVEMRIQPTSGERIVLNWRVRSGPCYTTRS